MTDLTLLVMAAGRGTRYGGLKQIEPLGPSGETIIDYSVFDAMRSGFRRVVFVIRRDIERAFRDGLGRRIEQRLDVHYVFQDEAKPGNQHAAVYRERPWGTAHALLTAAPVIREPFAVINADDFYGLESFRQLSGYLDSFTEDVSDSALVGFYLRNTLSDFGPVKRGLCTATHDFLSNVTEIEGVEADGKLVKYVGADKLPRYATGDEIVSMNMWGFHPSIFSNLNDMWDEFLQEQGMSETAEFYIPNAVTKLIGEGKASCRILRTPDSWFGVTYREDRSTARNRVDELISRTVYPKQLWP